jgi:hypothetical protein
MLRIVSDVNKSKLQQDMRSWLSPPDPWMNHKIACELRHTGTSAWFVEGDTFSEWKWSKTSSVLWIHGKRSLSPAFVAIVETDSFSAFSRHRKDHPLVCGLLDFFRLGNLLGWLVPQSFRILTP